MKSEYFMTMSSRGADFSYTFVSMIMNYRSSFESGKYYSDELDFNTRIQWHCYDDKIYQIGDFLESLYYRKEYKR